MNIGDIVYEKPYIDSEEGLEQAKRGPQPGKVVYIHPEGRFYIVEFNTDLGYCWRECFYFPERRGNPNAPRSLITGYHQEFSKIPRGKGPLYGYQGQF